MSLLLLFQGGGIGTPVAPQGQSITIPQGQNHITLPPGDSRREPSDEAKPIVDSDGEIS